MKILAWNIEGRLSPFATTGRGTPEHILSEIAWHDADVAILLEASEGTNVAPEIDVALRALGYKIYTARYDDKGDRRYAAEQDPTVMLLSRFPVSGVVRPRYGDVRNGLVVDVYDPRVQVTFRVFGIHLDDRSEANRILQIRDIIKEVNESPHLVVLGGDFNAMHDEDLKARLLRLVFRPQFTRFVPSYHVVDIVNRLYEMAQGNTLAILEDKTGLGDVDQSFRATSTPKLRGQMMWLPSVRMIQIDHFYIPLTVEAHHFQIAHDGGSDHRAISAYLQLRQPE